MKDEYFYYGVKYIAEGEDDIRKLNNLVNAFEEVDPSRGNMYGDVDSEGNYTSITLSF